MQSKMTEREYKNRLDERVDSAADDKPFSELAAELAREAGLEFAPEPVKLPERLAMAGRRVVFDQNAPFDEQTATDNQVATAIVYGGASLHPASVFNEKVVREMVARYNAYPGLRAAANALHAEMVKLWPDPCTYGHRLRACLDAVKAELAKGPK